MKNGGRFRRAAAAIERFMVRATNPVVEQRTADNALAAFAAWIERTRVRRDAGELLAYTSSSFVDLAAAWGSYYGAAEMAPAALTREIDGRFAARTGPHLRIALSLLLYARRYRQLARDGQKERFRDPWTPGLADVEALTAEFNAATPDPS